MVELNRRKFISGLAVGGSVGLSGCIGPFNSNDSEDSEPSIKILSPSDGKVVPLNFNVRVKVNNYNIRPLDIEEDYGTVDILVDKEVEPGQEVPKGRGYFGFSQGQTEGKIEVPGSGEYNITAVITDKNQIVTEYQDTVTIEAQKQYEFINVFVNAIGTESYHFYFVRPERELDSFMPENGLENRDPSIRFVEGESYKIYLGGTAESHPFEIQDSNGNPLLSMENQGELESEESIEWNSDSGVIEFTATEELVNRADKYVCTNHSDRMTGDILSD